MKSKEMSQQAADAPVVSQDLSELRPAATAAEAPARAGGGAGLQRLARGAQAGPRGAAAPGRCEPADGGRAPPGPSAALRARRAQGRRTCSGRSCRAVTLKEMKTLRAHSFSQRRRFEQVVGYLERNEPLPLDQPDGKATTFITLLGRLCAVQQGPQPAASAAQGDS